MFRGSSCSPRGEIMPTECVCMREKQGLTRRRLDVCSLLHGRES